MKKSMKFFLGITISLLASIVLQSQTPDLRIKLNREKVVFGDTVGLSIRVENPGNVLLHFPLPEPSELNQGIEIFAEYGDTVFDASQKVNAIEHKFLLGIFVDTTQEINGFKVHYMYPSDSAMQTLTIPPIHLEIMPFSVDTTQTIRDIQPIQKEPFRFDEIKGYILLGVGILAVVLLWIYFIRRYLNREKLVFEAAKPPVPAEILALGELEKLRQRKLWQSERVKEYYTELTDILREYLHGAYNIQAAEMTSDEILEAVRETTLGKENEDLLQHILTTSDLVKFAKSQPLPNEHDANMGNAVVFVNQTTADRQRLLVQQAKEEELNEKSN